MSVDAHKLKCEHAEPSGVGSSGRVPQLQSYLRHLQLEGSCGRTRSARQYGIPSPTPAAACSQVS